MFPRKKVWKTREFTCEFIKMYCVLMVTFSEGNRLAEVEGGDSKDTLACDDDAHKADVCT